jgi:hypothetical protein
VTESVETAAAATETAAAPAPDAPVVPTVDASTGGLN